MHSWRESALSSIIERSQVLIVPTVPQLGEHACNPRCNPPMHADVVLEYGFRTTRADIIDTGPTCNMEILECKRTEEYPPEHDQYTVVGAWLVHFLWKDDL